MAIIPAEVKQAWENRNGAVVLTTVDAEGMPNAIYATCVNMLDDESVAVCDNFFNKTRANILAGSKGTIVFITKEGKSFQFKGEIDYVTEGPIFETMKTWVKDTLPREAVAVLKVEAVYSGANKLA